MKILVVSDPYIPKEVFRNAFEKLDQENNIRFVELNIRRKLTPQTESEKAIKEFGGHPEQLIEEIDDADILVVHGAPVTEEVMKAGKNLKVIGCPRGGPVNVDLDAATRLRIPLVNTPGRNADAVADFTVGLIISEARHIARSHCRLVTQHIWRSISAEEMTTRRGVELSRKTLGLVGFGNVGKKVAKRVSGFDMRIIVYDPYVTKEVVEEFGGKLVSLEQVMRESDFVSLHARVTPETIGMIGKEQIALMKPTAFLINTARGMILDYRALYEALKERKIKGAALDVFEKEPMDLHHPLFSLDNITVTSHLAGTTREVPSRAAEIIAEEVERFVGGRDMRFVLNPEVLKKPVI